MICLFYVVIYHAIFAGGLIIAHAQVHSTWSALHSALAVFEAINTWVAMCELSLLCYCRLIQKTHEANEAKLGVGKLAPIFLFEQVPVASLFSLRYWSVMWSTYCALDPAYADQTSFGFCIDIGNGITTLIPSIIFAAGMTWPILSPRVLGMLGLVVHYQEFYGTCLYFFQYFFNERYKRVPRAQVLGIVVPANAIWMVFPAMAMWASSQLILQGDFSVFR